MQRVKQIFDDISATNSRIEKQNIIRKNKDNKQFTDALIFLLSPYVVTGFSEKKISKKLKPIIRVPVLLDWQSVVSYLKTHNTGSDNDIRAIQGFISNQDEDMQDFYKSLITKTLKLGIDAKTVNDAIPDLIPTFT